jgi:hypothetical protein
MYAMNQQGVVLPLCMKCGSALTADLLLNSCRVCGQALSTRSSAGLRHVPSIPWEKVGAGNFFQALLDTTTAVLFKPALFFDDLTHSTNTGMAWLYGLIVGSIGLVFGFIMLAFTPSTGIVFFDALGLSSESTSATAMVSAPLVITVNILFFAIYCQVLLVLRHHKKRPVAATFRAVCYAQSATLLTLIPFVGSIISTVWYCWLIVTGIGRTHELGRMQTALLLTLPLIFVVVVAIFFSVMLLATGLFSGGLFKEVINFIR